MEETLKKILEELKCLNTRVGGIEEGQQNLQIEVKGIQSEVKVFQYEIKTGLEDVNKKLDHISIQVAHNTEQEVIVDDLSAIVEEHTTDIKLLKKIVINQ